MEHLERRHNKRSSPAVAADCLLFRRTDGSYLLQWVASALKGSTAEGFCLTWDQFKFKGLFPTVWFLFRVTNHILNEHVDLLSVQLAPALILVRKAQKGALISEL